MEGMERTGRQGALSVGRVHRRALGLAEKTGETYDEVGRGSRLGPESLSGGSRTGGTQGFLGGYGILLSEEGHLKSSQTSPLT